MRMRFVLHKFETIFYAQELRLTHMIATRVYSVRLCVCVFVFLAVRRARTPCKLGNQQRQTNRQWVASH